MVGSSSTSRLWGSTISLPERQPGALPAGQFADLPLDRVAREPEGAQVGAEVLARLLGHAGPELVDHRLVEPQHLDLVLGEAADLDVGAERAPARQRGDLAEQEPQQRGLAGAVGPDEADAHPPLDDQVHAAEDDLVAVAGGDVLQLGHDPRRPGWLGELEPGLHLGGVGHLDRVELLQRLDAALDLAGLGRLVAESFDEPLGGRHLPGLAGGRRLGLGDPLLPLGHELDEAADVLGDPCRRTAPAPGWPRRR